MNEMTTIYLYERITEACDRNKFTFKSGRDEGYVIKAWDAPYAQDVIIYNPANFREALAFLTGYEQHKFEKEITK